MTNEEFSAINKDGGTAFPAPWGPGFHGMTLRDLFACVEILGHRGNLGSDGPDAIADRAYLLADSMIERRAADQKARDEAAGDRAEELRDG